LRIPGREPLYEVMQRWVDDCLLKDGSLFEPGATVWTEGNLASLSSGSSTTRTRTPGRHVRGEACPSGRERHARSQVALPNAIRRDGEGDRAPSLVPDAAGSCPRCLITATPVTKATDAPC
jgi:hypothetical protein